MIRYRPFRNTDPPVLAEIWRSQTPLHRLAQPMTAALWEQYVLSKAWFDPRGLLVATEGPRPIGFLHAGFGPLESGTGLDTSRGVISRLLVGPHADRGVIMAELLSAGENYLAKAGAREVVIDHIDPLGPFYLDLYGGALLAGTLESDAAHLEFFQKFDYQPAGQRHVLQRSLLGFRPPVDRDQIRLRKCHEMSCTFDALAKTWWEACATSHLERTSFTLQPKGSSIPVASLVVAQMEAFTCAWGVQTAGIHEAKALPEAWQSGTALLLIADALKALQVRGSMLVEAVVEDLASPLGRILTTLGFREVDRGVVLQKTL